MGLFTKKLPSHEEKLSLAYRGFKQDMVEMIFPGKKQQADCVVRSLAVITATNLNSCDAKDYFDRSKRSGKDNINTGAEG